MYSCSFVILQASFRFLIPALVSNTAVIFKPSLSLSSSCGGKILQGLHLDFMSKAKAHIIKLSSSSILSPTLKKPNLGLLAENHEVKRILTCL